VVKQETEERARIQARLQELEKERKGHLAQIRRAEAAPDTLDAVMIQGLRKRPPSSGWLRDQAGCRGFALQ
jgi:hypothetical protein